MVTTHRFLFTPSPTPSPSASEVSLRDLVTFSDPDAAVRHVTSHLLPHSLPLEERQEIAQEAFLDLWETESRKGWPARWPTNRTATLRWRIYRRAVDVMRSRGASLLTREAYGFGAGRELGDSRIEDLDEDNENLVAPDLYEEIDVDLFMGLVRTILRNKWDPVRAERSFRILQMLTTHTQEEIAEVLSTESEKYDRLQIVVALRTMRRLIADELQDMSDHPEVGALLDALAA